MTDPERERLVERIAELEDQVYRLSVLVIQLNGGEVRSRYVTRGRGRPKGSSRVSAAQIMTKFREMSGPDRRHVSQEKLAEELDLSVDQLRNLLVTYALGWPLD